jgi:diguanylate cyclase (GGDEF)-like protein/PAS domain S-box-containing protein
MPSPAEKDPSNGPRSTEEALREAEERFRTAFEQAPIGMALEDLDGRLVQVNHKLCEITGFAESELLERTFRDITHPEDVDADVELRRRALIGERDNYQIEKRYTKKNGDVAWARLSVSLLRDVDGRPRHFIAQLEDVTDRKEAEEKLLEQALRDPLTGLYNRVMFMDRLSHALARSGRQLRPVAVLFVDLDHFKGINDSHGHRTGDQVLTSVARRLEKAVRPADTVARFGGDEFAVLCEDIRGESDAVKIAERLSDALQDPVPFDGGAAKVGASIGIAFAQEGDDPDTLLRHADAAMYRVKEGGRGAYEIYLDAL